MPQDCTIEAIARALCTGSLETQRVWQLPGTQDHVQFPASWTLSLSTLRDAPTDAPAVIVAQNLRPSELPALRANPPALLVLTGEDRELLETLRRDLPKLSVLGPRACLRVDLTGHGALLALDPAQLMNPSVQDALQPRIQVAPTAPWLLPGLLDLSEQGQRVTGWIRTDALNEDWRQLLQAPNPPALCAICSATLAPTPEPWSSGLQGWALAHDLSAPLGLNAIPQPQELAALAKGDDAPTPPLQGPAHAWDPERWDLVYEHTARLAGDELRPAPTDLRHMPPQLAHWVQSKRSHLERWQAWSDAPFEDPLPPADNERSLEVLQAAAENLTDHESKVVLKGWGLEVTRQAVGKSTSAALSYAQKIGYPVALKAISPALRQKSRVDCVTLDVHNASALKRHYQKINDRAIEEVGETQLDGVLVSEMVPPGLDVEVRVLKSGRGNWVLYARCLQVPPQYGLALGAWGTMGTLPEQALRFADRVIPAKHPQRECAIAQLAEQLHMLQSPLNRLSERLFCVELDPLRILLPDGRPPTVLDAHIEQDAHIQGL